MGGLSHYLEDEGLSTTQISLIREHTEQIRPPRALWVPFDLGRPLGVPNDEAFQTRVLMETLKLLNSPSGPVLAEFTEEAPDDQTYGGPPACPVDFHKHTEPITALDQLIALFKEEFSQMRSWYDLAREKRGRTTATSSEAGLEELLDKLIGFLKNGSTMEVTGDISRGTTVRMSVEDLKAYYFEAVTIQPGQPKDSRSLAEWFWGETLAAKLINRIRVLCKKSQDDSLRHITRALIPKAQLYRFE